MYLILKGTKSPDPGKAKLTIVKQFKRKSNAEKYMVDNNISIYEQCDKKTMPSLVVPWCIKEV